jgi:hypothetical protein
MQVDHDGGSFRKTGDGQWAEYNPQGAATYAFAETGRDDWSVYLVDRSRNVEIQLDVYRQIISYARWWGRRGRICIGYRAPTANSPRGSSSS